MFESMLKADLVVVLLVSGILFEILAVGCILISFYFIDNQLNIYIEYKKLNAIVDEGDFKKYGYYQEYRNLKFQSKLSGIFIRSF